MARKRVAEKPRPRSPVLRLLGGRLRRLRLERKLSQEALAEKAQLNYKHIGRIELGKAEAGAYALVRLARALQVPVGELFETITPTDHAAFRFSPGDVEDIKASVAALTAVVDRLRAREPRPVSIRAPRRPRR